MEALLVVALLFGFVSGFWAGRRWAERSRAAFEARAAWQARRRYRGTRPF